MPPQRSPLLTRARTENSTLRSWTQAVGKGQTRHSWFTRCPERTRPSLWPLEEGGLSSFSVAYSDEREDAQLRLAVRGSRQTVLTCHTEHATYVTGPWSSLKLDDLR